MKTENKVIKHAGIVYVPGKTYFVADGRSAWDTVLVGLFNTYEECAGAFPNYKEKTFVRQATEAEIVDYFNLDGRY